MEEIPFYERLFFELVKKYIIKDMIWVQALHE